MTLRRLGIATLLVLLLAVAPIAANAASPTLSAIKAEQLARDAKGITTLMLKYPMSQWSCVFAGENAFWNCALNAASDGQAIAIVKIYDPGRRVWSVTLPRNGAPATRLTEKTATVVAAKDAKAAAWIARYREHDRPVRSTATLDLGTWRVKWWSEATQIAEVGVLDTTRTISYVRTGPQVAWSMARGGQGFGRLINEPWALGPLIIIFALVMLDWRRLRSWRTLDIFAIVSLAGSLWCFNRGLIFWAVPLQYPPLVYLFVRMIMIGTGRSARPAFTTRLPFWVMVVLVLILAGGRAGFNAYSSNVVDVGYAGVVGADRILDGRSPYGNFPTKTATPCGTRYSDGNYSGYIQPNGHCETAIERGDTYGPAMYTAYLPGVATLGWSGRWDDLPAAHFTSGFFDLLAGIGLALFGWQFGGRRLAAAMALFWFAVPWTAYTFMSDSNDTIVAAYLAWSAALIARPVGRGAFMILAALAKFAPLILLPLWLRLDRQPPPPRGEWSYGNPALRQSRAVRVWSSVRPGPGSVRTLLGMVIVTALLAALLVALDGTGALRTFWDRTFGWQLDRPSPFSLWDWGEYPGFPDLAAVQRILKAALVFGAVALFFVPRRLDATRALAFAGALMIGFQLVLTHWMYLYLPWVMVFVAIALLAPRVGFHRPRRSPKLLSALPRREHHLIGH
ncbi:MAG: hypothetical protein CK540_04475 [Thermoleophilia bacterium]|nr:MAG: hypothetical protein CK540_04475 [Thermoleophilia bacterium]